MSPESKCLFGYFKLSPELNCMHFNSEENVSGSFSQFQFWRGKHMFGNQQRCFSKEDGNIVTWKHFEESDLTGAFFYFPSLCDGMHILNFTVYHCIQ